MSSVLQLSDSMVSSCNGSFRFTWNPYSPKASVNYVPWGLSSASSTTEEPSVGNTSEVEEDDDLLFALGTIASLREEPTDAALEQTICRMPSRTHALLLGALEQNEPLLLELLFKERGNVVAQLISTIGGRNCAQLVDFVLARTVDLALDQSGCIAYTRVFDACAPEQQEALCNAVKASLPTLTSHQYGNYVIQCILKSGDETMFAALRDYLTSDGVLLTLCTNKFGSHVSESFIKSCSASDFTVVAEYFLSNSCLVAELAGNRFGNYFVQNVLRRIQTVPACSELTQWCLVHIPSVVAESQYALNISRALGIAKSVKRRINHL